MKTFPHALTESEESIERCLHQKKQNGKRRSRMSIAGLDRSSGQRFAFLRGYGPCNPSFIGLSLDARPGKGRHRHRFLIRGLVLSGTFVVTTDAEPVAHGVGQVFAVPEGQLHDESIGPEGARILVGRKYSTSRQSSG